MERRQERRGAARKARPRERRQGGGAGLERGCSLIRFPGFIAWGAARRQDVESLPDLEREVNHAATSLPAVIICTYGVPGLSRRPLVEGGLATRRAAHLDGRTPVAGGPSAGRRGRIADDG